MNEISFPLLDNPRRSISLRSSREEDFLKHDRASVLV
jgi:hypothetical protein